MSLIRAVDRNLVAECVLRAGWKDGPRVAQFLTEWAIAELEIGHQIGIEEFGEWWERNIRTAYRRLAAFRAAFPELGPEGSPAQAVRATRTVKEPMIEWRLTA